MDELASQFPCPVTIKGVFVFSDQQLVTPGSRNGSFFQHRGNLSVLMDDRVQSVHRTDDAESFDSDRCISQTDV